MKTELYRRILERKVTISVIGLGYVGLPTATVFASVGFRVIGIDIDPTVVDLISRGLNRIPEPGLAGLIERVVNVGLLKATTDHSSAVRKSDVVIISVPTPLREDGEPDLSYLESACRGISSNMNKGKLIIVESTVAPGTIKGIVTPLLESLSGLKCGLDFYLAYCPERIAPGKALKEFVENPRLIGGYDEASRRLATELFQAVVKGPVLVTDVITAEVVKLAENTFRDVNIAFANELALICEHLGVDVKEVIRLANTHPRVNIHSPGPGVGGLCLPKDPYLLLHPVKVKDFKSFIIEFSRKLNDSMPLRIVRATVEALQRSGRDVKNARIAILGTAYKANVGDPRLSPAKTIIGKLKRLGASVIAYDPYCKESFGVEKAQSLIEAVREADCLIIVTDHSVFNSINLSKLKSLMKSKPIIVDGRRIIVPKKARELGFVYYGIGYGFHKTL